MLSRLLVVAVVLTVPASALDRRQGPPRMASAVCGGLVGASGSCRVVAGSAPGATVYGVFDDTVAEKGFATLRISGSVGKQAKELAFAAGVVEGYLTAERTAQHFNTSFGAEFGASGEKGDLWKRARLFLTENDAYVRGKIQEASVDSYWQQVDLVWAQLDGLVDGHRLAAQQGARAAPLDFSAFLFMNALVDLSTVISEPFATDISAWRAEDVARYSAATSHCSALVKVTPDFSELWTAHNTWTGFFTMLRVAKMYDLPIPGVAAQKAAFPGYFGTLSSNDDLFVLSSGLVVQETTNAVYPPRKDMYTSKSVLTWARTVIANRVAWDGKTWVEWFSRENSGTINNQWMIVDYNKFVPYHPLPNGTLWVLEQLPEYVQSADLTPYLQNGHWPSYNQPFFPEVRNLSGNDEMARRFGLQYTYELNPRAKIFRRDAPKVTTREELRKFMRYNDWQHDPFSIAGYGGAGEPKSPENAIAARSDLIPPNSTVKAQLAMRDAFGNTDAKVVGREDVLNLQFEFVVGPTADQQVPFEWSGDWTHVPHEGQPTRFNFHWQSVTFHDVGLEQNGVLLV